MAVALAREALIPPATPGLGRAVALAVLVHAALVLALSLAVQWRQSAPAQVAFSAELWAKLPTQAGPSPAPPPAESVPDPVPDPTATPLPEAHVTAPPPTALPEPPQVADIALDKKKSRPPAQQKPDRTQAQVQAALRLQKDKLATLQAERQKAAQRTAEQRKVDQRKADQRVKDQQAAQASRQKSVEQARLEAAQSAQRVKEQADRALRLAGAAANSGEASGSATQSAGPSAAYGAKIEAAIRPNITQIKDVAGNPSVEYDVYTDPSGNVFSAKLRKKSGDPYWDEIAYNAILKTAKLPRDETGRVPSPMTIVLEPKAR